MQVVGVRVMGMGVLQGRMAMPMGVVRAGWNGNRMHMLMVRITDPMGVRMTVFERLVAMRVGMTLGARCAVCCLSRNSVGVQSNQRRQLRVNAACSE